MTVFGLVAPGRVSGTSRPVRGPASKGRSGRGGRSGRSKSGGRNVHTRKPGVYSSYRPPVPEPLPPAPLLKPTDLLVLGALVAAQAWGRWNQKDTSGYEPLPPDTVVNVIGKLGKQGGEVSVRTISPFARGAGCSDRGTIETDWGTKGIVAGYGKLRAITSPGGSCGSVGSFTISVNNKANTWTFVGSNTSSNLNPAGSFTGLTVEATYTPTGDPVDTVQPWEVEPHAWLERPKVKPLPQRSPEKPGVKPRPQRSPEQPVPRPLPPTQVPGNGEDVKQPGEGTAQEPQTVRRPRPVRQPLPQDGVQISDGVVEQPTPLPPPTTDPDAHYPVPGGGPITGNGPQAKPEEIAKELGRLEQKLNKILNPTPDTSIEWLDLLRQVLEAIMDLKDGTTYTITEKCPPCDGSQYDPPTVEAEAPGALNAFGVITNRLDAIAALLDGQLGLKQQICPPCKPTIRGELVTINFQSDPAEVPSRYAIKKHFSYRDQSGRDEEFHLQHWEGFSWDTGAAIVTSKGLPWGIVKVWAVDNAEGQRVIAHAAAAAGVNLNDPKHEWVFSTTDHPRYGRQGTVWPVKWDETGKLMISKRGGPSGLPGYKRGS